MPQTLRGTGSGEDYEYINIACKCTDYLIEYQTLRAESPNYTVKGGVRDGKVCSMWQERSFRKQRQPFT